MRLHDPTTEPLFVDPIDARFPYDDKEQASTLIRDGQKISLNAAFCVLHEICRAPQSNTVSKRRQLELLSEWTETVCHEIAAPVLKCARALIEGERLPWNEAVEIMEQIGSYDGQRAALAIAYFSGDCDTDEGDIALNDAQNRIRSRWDQMGI